MPSAIATENIFPGAAVAQNGDRASLASPSKLASHIVTLGGPMGGIVSMLARGTVFLDDWTLAAGSKTLTIGVTYFAGVGGKLVTSGGQPVGIAITKNSLSVTIQDQRASAAPPPSNNAALLAQMAALQAQIIALASQIPTITSPEFPTGENKDISPFVQGMAIARSPSGTGFIIADSASIAKDAIGLSVAAVAVGASGQLQIEGAFKMTDWTPITGTATLQTLASYYLVSSGQLSPTSPSIPGNISQLVGIAISPDTLILDIEPPILL